MSEKVPTDFDTRNVDALAAVESGELLEVEKTADKYNVAENGTLAEHLEKNSFSNFQKTIAIGYLPVDNPLFPCAKASTKISLFKLSEVVELLLKMECYDPVVQIREDGILVFRESEDNNVGLLVCPIKDIEEEGDIEE